MARFKQPYSLYKRPIKSSKKPVYHFWYYDSTGRRRSASTGSVQKGEAEKYAKHFLENLEHRPLKEIAETWWTWDHPYVQGKVARGLRISRGYVDTQKSYLTNQVIPYLGELRPPEITPRILEEWILKLNKKKLSASTVGHAIAVLRPILDELVRDELLSSNPANGLQGISKKAKSIEIPNHTELKQILSVDNWDTDKKGKLVEHWQEYWLATTFCAYGGMRQGEVLAIRRDDVINYFIPPPGWEEGDPEDYVPGVWIRHSWDRKYGLKETKTGKERFVPLPIELLMWAERRLEENGGPFVFGGKTPVYWGNLATAFKRAQEKAKITEPFRFHSLRHYLNSYLLVEKSLSKEKVQTITGHATSKMTMNYAHVNQETMKELSGTLSDLFNR